jgi:amino acid efflux transporter
VLAVALTMGTMNVNKAGAAKLAAALAEQGALPRWLAGGPRRSVPRRPLAVLAVTTATLLTGLVVGVGSASGLVRATSALFIAVYVLALLSAVRILEGRVRVAAVVALVAALALAVFSGWFLLVPVSAALVSLALRRWRSRLDELAEQLVQLRLRFSAEPGVRLRRLDDRAGGGDQPVEASGRVEPGDRAA